MLELISEGLKTREINRRAAKFTPPFKVSRQQVDYYRDSRGVRLAEITEASESDALQTGLALREERVSALKGLAALLLDELCKGGRLWLPQVKLIGTGRQAARVDYEEFNRDEVNALRALLDDLAKETGGRTYVRAADFDEDADTAASAAQGAPQALTIKVQYLNPAGDHVESPDAAQLTAEDKS